MLPSRAAAKSLTVATLPKSIARDASRRYTAIIDSKEYKPRATGWGNPLSSLTRLIYKKVCGKPQTFLCVACLFSDMAYWLPWA